MSRAAHDERTPLTSGLGSSETLNRIKKTHARHAAGIGALKGLKAVAQLKRCEELARCVAGGTHGMGHGAWGR